MSNRNAQLRVEPQAPARRRGIPEQLALNRRAVAFADAAAAREPVHAGERERMGVLQLLRRRPRLRRV